MPDAIQYNCKFADRGLAKAPISRRLFDDRNSIFHFWGPFEIINRQPPDESMSELYRDYVFYVRELKSPSAEEYGISIWQMHNLFSKQKDVRTAPHYYLNSKPVVRAKEYVVAIEGNLRRSLQKWPATDERRLEAECFRDISESIHEAYIMAFRQSILINGRAYLSGVGSFNVKDDGHIEFTPDNYLSDLVGKTTDDSTEDIDD